VAGLESETPRTNYIRRTIGAAICLAPLAMLLVSLVAGLIYPRESGWGVGISLAGLLVGSCNLYLAFIRPSLHVWRHGSTQGVRNVSVIPFLGTLLMVSGGVVGFCDWQSAVVGIAALAIDFGGLPWFLAGAWNDSSLWDGA
jgi:hypothetical protein